MTQVNVKIFTNPETGEQSVLLETAGLYGTAWDVAGVQAGLSFEAAAALANIMTDFLHKQGEWAGDFVKVQHLGATFKGVPGRHLTAEFMGVQIFMPVTLVHNILMQLNAILSAKAA